MNDYFDCNIWLDADNYKSANGIYSTALSYTKSPEAANEFLLRQYEKSPERYYAYTAAPVMRWFDVDLLVRSHAACIRLFPKRLNFSLAGSETEPLLKELESRRLPVMVWHTETTWSEISAVCERYPMLPVIIDGNDKKLLYHNRVFIPLMLKNLNLYLETFNLIQYLFYETLVNKYSIDRFVFGTNYPQNSPLAPLNMLLSADIPEEAREKILNGNIKTLISNII
ncbi:MAG: amidohydrolase family protein [Oscillospiraceae bacterium]|nr:amidohydrolase family protein [Oscillospiraceae bacterium]